MTIIHTHLSRSPEERKALLEALCRRCALLLRARGDAR